MARLRVGILGCGNIAAIMAETIRKTRGFQLYAVASRNEYKAAGFAGKEGARKAYGSYEELLKDPKVDLVYIATPHSEHYAHAKMCIEYGKPCLVEKAFTVNEQQTRELLRLAEEKQVFITEAIWTRYMPFVQTMREVIDSGVIGQPVQLSGNLGYSMKHKQRLIDPALAGGALLDVGVYPLNFAAMLFGTDLLRIEASCTYTDQHLDEQENITLIYRDGRMATLSASMLGLTDRSGTIVGTEGCLVVENINNFEQMTLYGKDHKKQKVYKRPRQITGYEYELQACKRALENGLLECPEMPHEETIRMMRICDIIRREMGVIYPFENGSIPDPEEQGGTAPVTLSDPLETAEEEKTAGQLQSAERSCEISAEGETAAAAECTETDSTEGNSTETKCAVAESKPAANTEEEVPAADTPAAEAASKETEQE